MKISSPVVIMMATVGALVPAPSCYSDPVNSPPNQPEIIVPSRIDRGQSSTFTANASDPDHDQLTLQWSSGPGPCDPSHLPTGNGALGPSYSITLVTDAAGAACVVVVATDPHGAKATNWQTVMVVNHAPIAQIVVQQPAPELTGDYDLYSTFRLSGAGSSDPDGDPLSYTWTLKFPSGFMGSGLADCLPATSPTNLVECWGPVAQPGVYMVSLTVNDGTQDSQTASVTLIVDPDQPPCITQTSPADPAATVVWDPTVDKTFAVQDVADDGSPYPSAAPPSQVPLTFSWSLRSDGQTAWQPIAGYDMLASVTIPGGEFEIGDTVQVRVEVSDGTQQTSADLAACGDTDICPTGCPQRVTWTVDYQ